jgi:hypothetical protein
MYSSEYTSGFFGPAASHLAAPPSPRYEGNVRQAPSRVLKKSASIRRPLFGVWSISFIWSVWFIWIKQQDKPDRPDEPDKPT